MVNHTFYRHTFYFISRYVIRHLLGCSGQILTESAIVSRTLQAEQIGAGWPTANQDFVSLKSIKYQ